MAGASTVQNGRAGKRIVRYDVTYTADDTTNAITSLEIPVVEGLLIHWEHNPGATVATSGFAVTLSQETGVDALCGGGAGIVTTAGANDYGGPLPNDVNVSPVPVIGTLTFAATGNLVASATGVFSFYILPL